MLMVLVWAKLLRDIIFSQITTGSLLILVRSNFCWYAKCLSIEKLIILRTLKLNMTDQKTTGSPVNSVFLNDRFLKLAV